MIKSVVTVLALATTMWTICEAKVVEGTLQLDALNTERFVTKFSYSAYKPGKIVAQISSEEEYFDKHRHELRILLFDEERWQKYLKLQAEGSLCRYDHRLCFLFQILHTDFVFCLKYFNKQTHTQTHKHRERSRVALWSRQIKPKRKRGEKELKFSVSYAVKIENESRYTFIVMSDCHLEFYDAHPPAFKYHFEMLNGGSHLPADESRQAVVHGVLLLFLAVFGLMYTALVMNQLKKNGTVHLVGVYMSNCECIV